MFPVPPTCDKRRRDRSIARLPIRGKAPLTRKVKWIAETGLFDMEIVRRTRWKGGTVTRSGRRRSGHEWNDVANGLEMCELYGGGDSEKLRSKQRNVNYKVN